ncbi:Fibronectin-binding A domain protein [Oscillochloris trichoides DG-6]|uniref:Rqc2 homolog RqcH n=1 Tax=Oscillochloris trichoides DG-6 TaxID=765420 RepID=E1IIC3_9CHLR|nr:NFACT RNA binding domain-containing protein [Oscillochloris trichoides]EFO79073.1 Fibronectin-binding A domain protein [Oscillochloris trichoides DG-6]
MYFDALTMSAVADELRETIVGGRIQRVVLTGPLSIGLEIYQRGQRYHLLASAHPQFARVHLVQKRLSRGVEQATPLLLLMRKYLLGGRIVGIEQPHLERILVLSIAKRAQTRNQAEETEEEAGLFPPPQPSPVGGGSLFPHLQPSGSLFPPPAGEDEGGGDDEPDEPWPDDAEQPALITCDLIIEPMDRRSNIILVDDNNMVMESIKRVTPRMSQRVIMPRHVYELPPAQAKRDPTRAMGEGLAGLSAGLGGELEKALVTNYRGVSPQVAREVIFRSLGQPKSAISADLPWYSLAARLREIFNPPWHPCLVRGPDGPLAYAAYHLNHLANAQDGPSISAVLEEFYAAREELTNHTQRRSALAQQLSAASERLQHQCEQIRAELRKAGDLEVLRWEGEMIFAFLHALQPGQTVLTVEGRKIQLDPQRKPVEQAQERFKAYDKAKSALAGLPELLNQVEMRIHGVEQLKALLLLSDDYDQIEQIAIEAEEMGYLREHPDPIAKRRRHKSTKARPLQVQSSDGFAIVIGRSARQNEEVTFRIGRPEDLWLHARGIHGSHVIIRSAGREVPETTLLEAASLAAHFSQASHDASVEIDLCRRALVRKVVGGPIGLVTYQAERTIRAVPRKP